MFQIASESDQNCLLQKFRSIWIFLDLVFSLLPLGIKDLDFISCVMWPSQQIL
jgi:hypothetical protein